jgi:hypothetical protein
MKLSRRKCQKLLQRMETLLREVDRYADPAASAHTYRIVQTLLDVHGYVFERLLEHVEAAGVSGRGALEGLRHDEAISELFLLHGLHAAKEEPQAAVTLPPVEHFAPAPRSSHARMREPVLAS